jgi:hypothetical protein
MVSNVDTVEVGFLPRNPTSFLAHLVFLSIGRVGPAASANPFIFSARMFH